MSSIDTAEHKPEILIIRRGGHGDHDDHHGGAWKIAFADFMTAMMCFFLVMWLINAANEETKAAVASYFNPIKLTDRNASRKGLDEVGEGPVEIDEPSNERSESKSSGPAQIASEKQSKTETGDSKKLTDQHLFTNPYAVLAEIVADTGSMQNISSKGDGGAQDAGPATGASGGESYRDPFAPDFWSQEITPSLQMQDPQSGEDSEEQQDGVVAARPKGSAAAETAPDGETGKAERVPPKPTAAPEQPATAEIEQKAAEIRKQLLAALPQDSKLLEGISVEAGKDGVTISVTDQLNFGMFEIGSAVPRRDMVLAMEQIGKVLDGHKGVVHINGHTDARPYSGQNYDNWRLSTARAHSAYYMLVRGGLDEPRIVEVAGFADRKPKVPSDPLAASNRRIDILLEIGG
ncbi:MAG: MotB family protein [Mesorhizobium sp.]